MIKGISYLSFENGLEGGHPIDSALKQTKAHGFDALVAKESDRQQTIWQMPIFDL